MFFILPFIVLSGFVVLVAYNLPKTEDDQKEEQRNSTDSSPTEALSGQKEEETQTVPKNQNQEQRHNNVLSNLVVAYITCNIDHNNFHRTRIFKFMPRKILDLSSPGVNEGYHEEESLLREAEFIIACVRSGDGASASFIQNMERTRKPLFILHTNVATTGTHLENFMQNVKKEFNATMRSANIITTNGIGKADFWKSSSSPTVHLPVGDEGQDSVKFLNENAYMYVLSSLIMAAERKTKLDVTIGISSASDKSVEEEAFIKRECNR
jgi:hypothetical protein